MVQGRRVLDFAAGCGVAAIVAAQCGAVLVEAAEIDPLAVAAIGMNAALNGVAITVLGADVVGSPCRWEKPAASAMATIFRPKDSRRSIR
jgi:predicted nicotinamide N-methyase